MPRLSAKSWRHICVLLTRALATKSGEYDYPMADAFCAAYQLPGELRSRALTLLRALNDARAIADKWEDFRTFPEDRKQASVACGSVPRSWLTEG